MHMLHFWILPGETSRGWKWMFSLTWYHSFPTMVLNTSETMFCDVVLFFAVPKF